MMVDDIFKEIERLRRIESALNKNQNAESTLAIDERFITYIDLDMSVNQAISLVELDKGGNHIHPHLKQLAAAWINILSFISETDIPEEKYRASPIIFGLNLGNFDAVCVRDSSDRFGIGVDLEFIRGLEKLTYVISAPLNGWALRGYVSEAWSEFLNPSLPSGRQSKWLSSILNSIISDGSSLNSRTEESLLENMHELFSDFGRAVNRSVWLFIVAHEYSHYLLDHHNENSRTNRRFRECDLEYSMKKAMKKYPMLSINGGAFTENFLINQAKEYHADWQALKILEYLANSQPDEKMKKLMFISTITAVTIFFSYADSLERLVLIRMIGVDPGKKPLFREDAEVAELFIRSGYPSPYRRWQQMMIDIDNRRLGGEGKIALFVDPVWRAMSLAVDFERANVKYFNTAGKVNLKWRNRIKLASIIDRDIKRNLETDSEFPLQIWNLPEHVL